MNSEHPTHRGTTWCIFNGGPADGLHLPTAAHLCTRRIVLHRPETGTWPYYAHPAVYLRDEADQSTHEHRGADGVVRTFASLGYRFERYVDRELSTKIEAVQRAESDRKLADGAGL